MRDTGVTHKIFSKVQRGGRGGKEEDEKTRRGEEIIGEEESNRTVGSGDAGSGYPGGQEERYRGVEGGEGRGIEEMR